MSDRKKKVAISAFFIFFLRHPEISSIYLSFFSQKNAIFTENNRLICQFSFFFFFFFCFPPTSASHEILFLFLFPPTWEKKPYRDPSYVEYSASALDGVFFTPPTLITMPFQRWQTSICCKNRQDMGQFSWIFLGFHGFWRVVRPLGLFWGVLESCPPRQNPSKWPNTHPKWQVGGSLANTMHGTYIRGGTGSMVTVTIFILTKVYSYLKYTV